ncbi:uncharacterized protein I303_103948 [Kwoniella dejecticola CBS 10117]|uniref:Solute carrier family 29 (Equilibrative nucleoside transporter), member 1/2/3 n=1 Tax=Kwoniella dejecticola CBS 10117 TaxID=1296121 RepID=A0A1A6A860_9TREE|nr:uncharacterized protein I303_03965 [Kwoniella dejecticola CBS 10117]OBR86245.1 hypothetical protein I303_03965 [Kwoniella dejecticola CBS 10117]
MLRALRSLVAGPSEESRVVNAEYEPLSAGEDASASSTHERANPKGEVRHEPKVYLAFWVLGAGVLMSWNALICTIPLLTTFFPSDSSVKSNLASYISSSYCFGNLFFLGLAQRNVGKTSPSKRIHWSLLLLLLTSLILTFPLLPLILPSLSPNALFPVIIATTVVLSISTAYLQSGVFALSSLWGSEEILAVMSGQGGIAVLVSSVQLLLAIIAAGSKHIPVEGDNGETKASTLAGVGLWTLGSVGTIACLIAHRFLMRHSQYSIITTSNMNSGDDQEEKKGLTKKVFKKNLLLMIAVAWVFVVTLSIFPPVTTTILSTHNPTPRLLQPDVFIPLHFLLFNIGDYCGRTYLPSIQAIFTTSPPRILLLSLSRTLFIPLLFLCNTTPRTTTPVFDSDLIYLLIILSLGMTNGYIGSMCMIVASSPELNKRIEDNERDVAGTLASFCLVAGLAGGSAASFLVTYLIQ